MATPSNTTGSDAAGSVSLHGANYEYFIADDGGSLFVEDGVDGRDGIQDLSGVDQMVFTNGIGVFDPTGTAEQVSRLYNAAFNRGPDVAGLQFWTSQVDDSHVPLSQIASAFAASPEFTQNYGTLTDADFVQQLYQNVLHRAGDTDGVQFWQETLASGGSRGQVMNAFAQSPENRAATLTTAGDVNDAESYRLFQAALGRVPDQAGQLFWSSALTNGETPTQVAQGFVDSAEFNSSFGGLSSADFVSALYQHVLNRPGDAAGQAFWTNALDQGTSKASVIVAFSDGIENRMQTALATHANWVFVPA